MNTPLLSPPTVHVYGWCGLSDETIVRSVGTGRAADVTTAPGEFVAVVTSGDETTLISSMYGIWIHFYAILGGRLFHADTVEEVVRLAGLAWEWNWRAVADVALLEHTLGDDTLHPAVRRVPAGAVLTFAAGHLTTRVVDWDVVHPRGTCSPTEALRAFNLAIDSGADDRAVVSLSGGFDSRVILSSFLRRGFKPRAVSLGYADSTDVVIARAICDRFGLELRTVALEPTDYLNHAETISRLTSGTKTFANWHTYLYPLKLGCSATDRLWVGSNGEFARSFYFDKGAVARLADGFHLRAVFDAYWRFKLKPIFRPAEIAGLCAPLQTEFGPDAQAARRLRLIAGCPGHFLDGLDRLYLGQRVRTFIANGVRLYAGVTRCQLPFLDQEWVRSAWRLPRMWKIGSNWHRYALAKNCPELLAFPEEGRYPKMASKAPVLYWRPLGARKTITGYVNYSNWFQQGPIAEHFLLLSKQGSGIIESSTSLGVYQDHQVTAKRTRALSFLLGLLTWESRTRRLCNMH